MKFIKIYAIIVLMAIGCASLVHQQQKYGDGVVDEPCSYVAFNRGGSVIRPDTTPINKRDSIFSSWNRWIAGQGHGTWPIDSGSIQHYYIYIGDEHGNCAAYLKHLDSAWVVKDSLATLRSLLIWAKQQSIIRYRLNVR